MLSALLALLIVGGAVSISDDPDFIRATERANCQRRAGSPAHRRSERFRAEEQFWTNWDDANRKAEADD